MADESIEALERAWHDLFHKILQAGREEGERAAFDRVLQLIQTAAAGSGPAVAAGAASQSPIRQAEPREEISARAPAQSDPGVAELAQAPSPADARQSVVPLRTPREWDAPDTSGFDRSG